MIIKKSMFLKVLPVILLIFFSFGCFVNETLKRNNKRSAGSHIVGTTINDHETSVEIREMIDESGAAINKGYNHPYYFTEVGLANILSAIYYRERGFFKSVSKGQRKLFRHEELQKIIPPIINAFSMATTAQDVLVFSTSNKILLSDRQSYFSIFVIGSELNIVFSSIKSKKSLTDGRRSRPSNKAKLKDPFDVKKSSFWSVLPVGGQRLAQGHQNWLIIDLNSDLFGVAGVDELEGNKIRIGSSAKAVADRVGASKKFVQEKKRYQDVRVKLKELKAIKDDGLISEEDYNRKKKELLREF